ncbi:MAG TPA: cation diffusion facilitator family transporter [Terriglobales bacterium]|jgi:cobalt-zinc-cadmium efflux system protein|nr:cation diffusion facilitator family transporter [Terriglobales bacterium]
MHSHAGHGHSHGTGRVLRFSLGVTLLYVALLVVAGIRAHSLALLSEAGHNLSDFLALLLSLVAVFLEGRPPSATKTYGYRRAGVLAALVNALSLVIVSFFIFYEAFQRIQHPEQVRARLMIAVAAAGVVMNGVIALLLWRSGRDVNVRSALLHEVGDTLSTAAVIVGGFIILWTGQYWVDAALSFAIGALILWSSIGIVRETMNILLEGTPRGMSLEAVEATMRAIAGVSDVHDLHLWSIGSENHALSAHVKIADMATSESDAILKEINEKLGRGFGIHHTTIQLEHVVCETAHSCVIAVREEVHEHSRHDHSHRTVDGR